MFNHIKKKSGLMDLILTDLECIKIFRFNKLYLFIDETKVKHLDIPTTNFKKFKTTLSLRLKEYYLTQFYELCYECEDVINDIERVTWYITKVFNQASNIAVARGCIPECYHQYLSIHFTGSKEANDIFDETSYRILEEAKINTLLLGINK